MEDYKDELPHQPQGKMVEHEYWESEAGQANTTPPLQQLKSNFPVIALLSGITLFIFMAAATVGLLAYVFINRPTAEDRIAQIDLSRITSEADPNSVGGSDSSPEGLVRSASGFSTADSETLIEVSESSPASRVLPGGQTFTNASMLPELPNSYYEARLRKNISASSAPPSLEHDGGERRGPQRVQFIVGENGNFHDHPLGTATFAETEIVGAAGEWQIRPWWQPAWVPQSVDCGQPGTAAIGGHVSWQSLPGPFHDLGAMVAGDRIRCQSQTGEWFTYEVSEVVQIGYNNTEYYWETRSNLNDHQLTLFTCKPGITGIIVVRAQLVKF